MHRCFSDSQIPVGSGNGRVQKRACAAWHAPNARRDMDMDINTNMNTDTGIDMDVGTELTPTYTCTCIYIFICRYICEDTDKNVNADKGVGKGIDTPSYTTPIPKQGPNRLRLNLALSRPHFGTGVV